MGKVLSDDAVLMRELLNNKKNRPNISLSQKIEDIDYKNWLSQNKKFLERYNRENLAPCVNQIKWDIMIEVDELLHLLYDKQKEYNYQEKIDCLTDEIMCLKQQIYQSQISNHL